jgi:hypothetical protein
MDVSLPRSTGMKSEKGNNVKTSVKTSPFDIDLRKKRKERKISID